MKLQAADDQFAARVRESFSRQAVMSTLGAQLDEVREGFVRIRMQHRPELTQQHGFLHAGVVATALDSACGYAAYSLMPLDAAVLSIEFKINLLSPARGPFFIFEAQVTKAGRTITVADGRALQCEDAQGEPRLMATMTATLMTVLGRERLKA